MGTSVIAKGNHFAERGGLVFAGEHIHLDLWGVSGIGDAAEVEATLRKAASAAGATVLSAQLHPFQTEGMSIPGIAGVLVLAESHISIHTWPEVNLALIDIFMCGECDPNMGVPPILESFRPAQHAISSHKRGLVTVMEPA